MSAVIVVWLAGLLIVIVTAFGLLTSADWLLADVFGTGLPLGTLATAVSMIVLPALTLPMARSGWTRGLAWLLMIAGAAWLPVSAVLAGNLRLEFTNGPELWWAVTQGLPMLSFLLLLWVAASAAVRHWRNRDRRSG